MNIIDLAKSAESNLIRYRRTLHKIPELGFDLPRTSRFIRDCLDQLGIPYTEAAETGVVALIRGNGGGPTIAFRADMDALPIREETGLSFASDNGNMHACGHDAHMAILLSTAGMLKTMQSNLVGTVKLIFQPAEEGCGGAQRMIADGCLENPRVDAIFGLHVGQIFPEVSKGQIGYSFGPILAASTAFSVLIKGESAHGAMPHLGVDAIAISAEVITALQKIVSRETDPLNSAVLTVGQISGGEAPNIVTPRVSFAGDFRTLTGEDTVRISYRLTEICQGVARAGRAEAEVNLLGGYPVTVSDSKMVEKLIEASSKVTGRGNLVEIKKPNMGTEDMAFYLEKVPGAYFILGTGNPDKGIVYPHHNSRFDLDEEVLWLGPAIFTQLALDFFDTWEVGM